MSISIARPGQLQGAALTSSAILTIASRDVRKFFGDRARIVGALVFPIIFVGVLGGSLQQGFGAKAGFDLLAFTFIGIFAQTLFQSTVSGLTSLIEDRENDFSQEMFIAPISRYAIVFGKILGESLVAMVQAAVTVIFGMLLFHVALSPLQLLELIPVALAICLMGGSFGILVLSLFSNQRAANQIIPFVIFPQFFLAGVFAPIKAGGFLGTLSLITPLRYAVDLTRGILYAGKPEYKLIVLQSPIVNFTVMMAMFVVFLVVGTVLFVRGERNK